MYEFEFDDDEQGQCKFNCRTGRMWYYAGYRKRAGYRVPKEIIEEYYLEELRRLDDRRKIFENSKT